MSDSSDELDPSSKKRRREILGLKLMVYTAVVLLGGGFFYHYQALQSAQDEFHQEIQKTQAQVDLLMKDRAGGYGNPLEQTLIGMKGAISSLDQESQETHELAERIKIETDAFLEAFKAEHRNR